jgi:hypothetical protein
VANDRYMGLAVGLSLSVALTHNGALRSHYPAARRRREESGDVCNISRMVSWTFQVAYRKHARH